MNKIETMVTLSSTLSMIFEECNAEAAEHAIKEIGNNVMIYPCGFAWVYLSPSGKRNKLGKMLQETKLFNYDDYRKQYYYWVGEHNQSISHKEAHAKHLAELLSKKLDATFHWNSRMD